MDRMQETGTHARPVLVRTRWAGLVPSRDVSARLVARDLHADGGVPVAPPSARPVTVTIPQPLS